MNAFFYADFQVDLNSEYELLYTRVFYFVDKAYDKFFEMCDVFHISQRSKLTWRDT